MSVERQQPAYPNFPRKTADRSYVAGDTDCHFNLLFPFVAAKATVTIAGMMERPRAGGLQSRSSSRKTKVGRTSRNDCKHTACIIEVGFDYGCPFGSGGGCIRRGIIPCRQTDQSISSKPTKHIPKTSSHGALTLLRDCLSGSARHSVSSSKR